MQPFGLLVCMKARCSGSRTTQRSYFKMSKTYLDSNTLLRFAYFNFSKINFSPSESQKRVFVYVKFPREINS
jgi:hypothetical protein